jgi:hypothetical protein
MKLYSALATLALIFATQTVSAQASDSIYSSTYLAAQTAAMNAQPYSVSPAPPEATEEASLMPTGDYLFGSDLLVYYGHPNSRQMGILGRYTKDELLEQMTALAAEYDALNGEKGIIKGFYVIYGTVWPEGEIGRIKEATLLPWIEFALENDMLIFLDHQIGKYDPVESLKEMLPYLKYPNVHLALDPEWRTDKPMKEIGTVTAAELNTCQEVMSQYIQENELGDRLLVIHQFNYRMISNRADVRTDYTQVHPILCADGFGAPWLKKDTYAYIAAASNISNKGFKLFYDFEIPGAGIDSPLMSPEEVLALSPRPYLIMYQ